MSFVTRLHIVEAITFDADGTNVGEITAFVRRLGAEGVPPGPNPALSHLARCYSVRGDNQSWRYLDHGEVLIIDEGQALVMTPAAFERAYMAPAEARALLRGVK